MARGNQVLGDLGLSFQPPQPRLLVHASHLLAGGQPLTHDRDDLAVGSRLLLQRPSRQQVQAGPQLGAGHHRIRAAAVPRAAWQSAHISTVNRPSTLLKGPLVDPRMSTEPPLSSRTEVRGSA
jgi:hypothetical protein